jgi:hypothetical protein
MNIADVIMLILIFYFIVTVNRISPEVWETWGDIKPGSSMMKRTARLPKELAPKPGQYRSQQLIQYHLNFIYSFGSIIISF